MVTVHALYFLVIHTLSWLILGPNRSVTGSSAMIAAILALAVGNDGTRLGAAQRAVASPRFRRARDRNDG